jgi:hypothetical protein
MDNIQKIMKAAQDTASYIELMRLPSPKEPITNYAQLNFQGPKPTLQDQGYVMFSPDQARWDKRATQFSAVIFSPAVLILSGINGINANTRMGKMSNFTLFALALGNMGYHSYKMRNYQKAGTLVFPGRNK